VNRARRARRRGGVVENVRFALYLAIALMPSLIAHELAHAYVADRLGDPTPRRWGRLSLNPRRLIDPFGTVILPGLTLVLVASGQFCLLPIFAYAKPMPLDPSYLRNPRRDSLIVTLAGPVANLSIAAVAGLATRVLPGELQVFAFAWVIVNVFMFLFQLVPIPGLDGSRLLVRVLPPRAREVYANLDEYIVLFILVVFFVFAGPLLTIVRALGNELFRLLVGAPLC
jgi:Zn-dependent protease